MDRKPSFQRKSTLVNTNKFGEEVRPKLARVQTIDNMTDQLYNLMDSYLSNKVPDVQKQYPLCLFIGLSIMWSTLLPGQGSISRVYIVIKLRRTLFEIGYSNTSMIHIEC